LKPKIFFIVLILIVLAGQSFAQGKFAYINSQRILQEYQEAVDVQNKLDEIRNQYQAEYDAKLQEYQEMADAIESQSLLLSEEKKQEKLREIQQKGMEIEQYKYEKLGPEGEFYRKNLELTKPIYDKINKIIEKIGTDEEFDFIFDASSGALLHALPKYDLTDRVISELNEGSN
jgi:outer membrane protein